MVGYLSMEISPAAQWPCFPKVRPRHGAACVLGAVNEKRAATVDEPPRHRIVRRLSVPTRPDAPMAELVDALDSKSSSARSAGSIPARGTIRLQIAPRLLHHSGAAGYVLRRRLFIRLRKMRATLRVSR